MDAHDHELSAIPKGARSFQGQRAGVVTRVLAAGIDVAVVAAVLVAVYLGWAGLLFMVDPRSFTFPDTKFIASLLIAAATMFVYLTIAWAVGGRTYGNLLMGLRVVGVYGGDVGWFRAVLRAAFYVGLPIGLLWVAIDPRQRSIQDRVLATAVVYDWKPRVARQSPHADA
ncbi:MAG: RDD family protein [Nocardioides sp.]